MALLALALLALEPACSDGQLRSAVPDAADSAASAETIGASDMAAPPDAAATEPPDLWPDGPPPPDMEPPRTWVVPLSWTTFHIDFNIVNPLVAGYGSCFGANLNQLVHAGEDEGVAAQSQVVAVGDGEVVYAAYASYPGYVVVIRHSLTAQEQSRAGLTTDTIYSMYGHVNQPSVSVGDQVTAQQPIATVLNQGGNSHLHWEMRTADKPQLCGYNYPGPGYTGPGTDARDYGYLSPTGTVNALAGN